MLPSTGYFKGINCPFYDKGLCERRYCHFRHPKKEFQKVSHDTIESGAILQKLVSAAVQKVLQQTDSSGVIPESTIADAASDVSKHTTHSTQKVTYNPTPISELKKIVNVDSDSKDDAVEQRKRHIPVPYTPRKPTSLPIKRSIDTNGSSQPLLYIPPVKYTPGSTESVQLDQYTPRGIVDSEGKYLPGSEVEIQEYQPNESQKSSSKHNYVPSDKNVSKKKILEYKPAKLSSKTETSSVTYQPTPRSLAPCFSSDEDDPTPKKRKMSSDLNGLDELGEEFDILDQILDEEKLVSECEISKKSKDFVENKTQRISKDSTKTNEYKEKIHRSNKSDKKEKSKCKTEETKKFEHKIKSKDDDQKSSSKKSSTSDSKKKDKSNDVKKEKHHKDKSEHSSSKTSHKSSENSKHNSSRSSSKDSKHSSKSKTDSQSNKNDCHKSHKSSRDSKKKSKHRKSKEKQLNQATTPNDANNGIDCNNEELYDLSESDEESRALECKRIFEEYVPAEKSKNTQETTNKTDDIAEDEYIPTKKRISRTLDKNIRITPKPPIKPDFKVNAAQAMAERMAKVKEFHAAKVKADTENENISKMDTLKNIQSSSNVSSTKIRIAHVPYASTLMIAKKTITPTLNETEIQPSTSSTISQTVKKGVQRVAHMPKEKFIDRPGVLEPLGSKIPANIRSTFLNMMIDECLKIYMSATDAYARAQHEELTTSKKCSTVQIYKNSAVLTVNRLRKEIQECNGVKKSGSDCSTLQRIPNTISGNSGNSGSWSIESKNKRSVDNSHEFHGAKLYNNIKKWILTDEQLLENGFPRLHPSGDKGRAIIHGQKKQNPPKGYIRTCCRCKKDYTVDKKGFAAVKEECIYHPNNKYRVRGEVRYQCCSQDGASDGCCVAPSHVYEYVDYDNLKGYVKTLPPERELEDYGVYSLDCEMCYTTHGLDLTRITVINSDCKVVYETLIKPLHSIIDYNTRYSGITEEQMKGIKTTLLEVQATLLTMFNSKTILIGHSLESDFKALKLIHDTVIDTSVLFPHKMGPPYKRALRNLSSEHLKKIIQNSVDGHDSAEDATVCMELIRYKLKEDLKMR